MRIGRLLVVAALAALGCDDGGSAGVDPTLDAGPSADGATLDGSPGDGDAGATAADLGGADGGLADLGADQGGGDPCAAGEPADDLEVLTAQGLVRGEALSPLEGPVRKRQAVFRGIPFAAPPTGERRFLPPAPPACPGEVFAADTFGPECMQLDGDGAPTGSEDCLTLNVWRPAFGSDPVQRPVMVFIHGGGNVQGSAVVGAGDQLLYDGETLSRKHGVVVVTLQYRLGPLAWMVHPSLADADGRSGNLGTLDQIAALQWVRDNIGAFGGNRDNVTLFGESAGGRNVCVLKASPLASGLFHRAIMQSGACVVPERARVEADSTAQIEAVGCAEADDVAACLRALPAETLWTARPPTIDLSGGGSGSQLQPHIDGHVLTGQPIDVIAAGEHNAGPFIVGANADEIARYAPPLPTVAAYEAAVRAALGALADQALALYPADAYDTPRDAYVQLASDAQFVCNARAAARASAAAGDRTFLYHFAQPLTQSRVLSPFGAYHGVELFFVWDNMNLAGYQPTPAEEALAEAVGGYWSAFATTGDPNEGDAVAWPPYGQAADEHLLLVGDGIAAGAGLKQAECDFWDRIAGR